MGWPSQYAGQGVEAPPTEPTVEVRRAKTPFGKGTAHYMAGGGPNHQNSSRGSKRSLKREEGT